MRDFLSQFKRDFALMAAACIVLGLLLLLYPETSGTIISVIIALVLAAAGVMHILTYIFRRYPDDIGHMDLVFGLICAGLGVFLFLHPGILISLLPTVLGLLLIIDGIVKLQSAIDLARLHTGRWWIILILAAASIILGSVALINPFETMFILLMFIGASLIIDGLFDFWTLFSIHRRVKRFRKEMEEADRMARTKKNAIPVEPRD